MGTIVSGRAPAASAGLRGSAMVLVLASIVFVANFGYSRYLASRDTNARTAAAELQVLSQQLPKFAGLAVRGDEESFDALSTVKQRIDGLVLGLRDGSRALGIPAYGNNVLEPGAASRVRRLSDVWNKMAADADRVLEARDAVLATTGTAMSFNVRVPQISAQLAEVVRGMSDAGASASQINLANRQIVLVDRMSRRVTEILAGGDAAVTAADALQRDAVVFGQVLDALRDGNPGVGVEQVTNPAAAQALDKAAQLYADAQKEIEQILRASTDLAEVQQAAATLGEDSDVLLEESQLLHGSFGSVVARVFPNDLIGLAAGLAAMLALVGVLAAAYRLERIALGMP
jgi:twitching motility protein PilJ